MYKLKVGDWVKCVDDSHHDSLTLNEVYEVFQVEGCRVNIRNDSNLYGYYSRGRFELDKNPDWLTKKEYEEEINKLKSRYENTPLEYREPKLYRLICPLTERELYINQLKEYDWELVGYNFTQEEINDFWNQDFISKLIKKEYKKEN